MNVGMDPHKATINAAVMDENGTVLNEVKMGAEPDSLKDFSDSMPVGSDIVIESSSTWYWAYRVLSERHNVTLSNPLRTKAIAESKVKADKVDSLTLANLLRGGYVAESYMPPKDVMQLGEMVRHRASLVRARTIMKNRVHAHPLMYNIRIDGSPFTKEYIERLRELNDYKIDGYLNVIESLNKEIKDVSGRIMDIANEDARPLMGIPGISFYSAVLTLSEIGDISRFPDSEHSVSYAGLAPSTRSSGNTVYHGPITKQRSPYLRWMLVQVAWTNIRKEPNGTVGRFYAKLKKKKGSSVAIVAASAKLLRIAYWTLMEHRHITVDGSWPQFAD